MSITFITKESVKRIQRHRYFDENYAIDTVSIKNKQINSTLQTNLQRLMVAAFKLNSVEALIAVDLDNFSWVGTTDNSYDSVRLSEVMKNAFINSTHKFVIMHNHPSNRTFSLADVMVLANYPNLKIILVCPNDCSFIEMLYKGDGDLSSITSIIIKVINKLMSKGSISGHTNAKFIS